MKALLAAGLAVLLAALLCGCGSQKQDPSPLPPASPQFDKKTAPPMDKGKPSTAG